MKPLFNALLICIFESVVYNKVWTIFRFFFFLCRVNLMCTSFANTCTFLYKPHVYILCKHLYISLQTSCVHPLQPRVHVSNIRLWIWMYFSYSGKLIHPFLHYLLLLLFELLFIGL